MRNETTGSSVMEGATRDRNRGKLVVVVLIGTVLLASTAVSVYQFKGSALEWSIRHRLSRWREPIPDIPVQDTYAAGLPRPALAFPEETATVEERGRWQARARTRLRELLGVTLAGGVPGVVRVGGDRIDGISRETLVLTMRDGLEVPAFLLIPESRRPAPGVLVIPGHSRGIVATAGYVGDYQHRNALELAKAGYLALTIEVRGFGYLEHMDSPPNSVDLASHVGYSLIRGETALGLAVEDGVQGLNYLATRSDLAAGALGVVGFSSGGRTAILLAALEPRVRAVIASGCVSSHEMSYRYSRHDAYEAVPGVAAWLSMSDWLGLLAPTPLLVHWGELDNHPPSRSAAFNTSSLAVFEAARRIYAVGGDGARIERVVSPGLGHEFDNDAAREFLGRVLPAGDGRAD